MITPDELKAHLDMLKAAGVTGRVKIGDIEVTIAAPVIETKSAAPVTAKSLKAEYDEMLFACTEGIRDPEERS